ncbi:MAG: sialidase family protein [Limisphaerales bacterium]
MKPIFQNAIILLTTGLSYASAADLIYVKDADGEQPKLIVAITNVCAWPNLTLLPDGAIVATIHNQPSHLKLPSDVDCWASIDGGRSWTKRGTPARRDTPKTARGNVAAGLANNGDLLAIVSGWTDPTAKNGRGSVLVPLVSRSSDGGSNWIVETNAFTQISTPFGDVLKSADGGLRVALYRGVKGGAVVYRSSDDGYTWGEPLAMDPRFVLHEPALFHLGQGRWLAAARFDGLTVYTSDDDAKTWIRGQTLTGRQQHPGHFLRLKDGRILLTYGNRLLLKGVDARVSQDEGQTWSEPFRIADFQGDGGYPSSVQGLAGEVVTAY